MIYVHADVRQVNRSLWQGWVREHDLHASAPTRQDLLDFMESDLTEQYYGGGQFTLIVTAC